MCIMNMAIEQYVYTKRKTGEMGDFNTVAQIHMHYKRKSKYEL